MPRQLWISFLLVCYANALWAQPVITSFTLIDADANQPIAAFDPLLSGAVLNLPSLPTRRLNVRANTLPATVGSVRFGLDGNPNVRTENVAPYALAGDNDGDYLSWTPAVGPHTLTATAYTQANAGGTAGLPLEITFIVTDQPTPTPTGPTPTPLGTLPVLTFIAENDVVAVEVESAMPSGDWVREEQLPGFTGDCYFNWSGPDYFAEPGHGILAFNIRIERAATYQLRIRNYHEHPDGTQENDCWVRVGDEAWAKVWSPVVSAWNWESNFDFAPDNKPPASYSLSPGVYRFEIAGRSHNFRIDRFHLFVEGALGALDAQRPQSPTEYQPVVQGEHRQWHRLTLSFAGPQTSEDSLNNPFLNFRTTVVFTQGARSIRVPGYFAADGNAAETGATAGNVWRAHFVPDATGTWAYRATFHAGSQIAVHPGLTVGQPAAFHGQSGTFEVGPSDKTPPDFRAQGLLRYVSRHHLQFAGSGEYFLKGGADSPENFLGYHEFDGTYDTGGLIANFLHRYEVHVADWRPGDPVWQGSKGKGILGALNYLSGRGVNSVYFLTYNVDGGDGADTWPWTSHQERQRFDCSKLDQWEIVFSHMDARGIQLHVVTQENENDRALDGGELGVTRKLYYRELVARFAHHLALQWNLGEENTNTDAQRLAFAEWIRALDPYDHPITVHTFFNHADTYYDGLLGQPNLEATSIQGDGSRYNDWAASLRQRSTQAGRPWAIYGDEQAPAVESNMGNLAQLRRESLWGNLMGGGAGVEWYFGYQGNDFGDVQSENWRVAEPLWNMTRHALQFFHEYLPFWEMEAQNNLAAGTGRPLVLAKPGQVYAVYLPSGGNVRLTTDGGSYTLRWYNPRTGGSLQVGSVETVSGDGPRDLGLPPAETSSDWVALLRVVTLDASGITVK